MELLEAIKWAGVVGEGGAGFPTYAKLNTRAECFIVNGAECEPLIETDKYLMRTFPEEIIAGTAAVSAHLGAKRTVVALKEKYEAEAAALSAAIEKSGADIEIVKMPAFYPAGDEHTMVYYVTGRSIPARGIPISVGCVVDNVGTMRSVHEALEGRQVTDKYLSVTGAVREPVMLRVPVGTSFRECVALAGTKLSEYAVINGGPMMGRAMVNLASPVTKGCSGITVMSGRDAQRREASQCIKCAKCVAACPMGLEPYYLSKMTQKKGWEEVEAQMITSCIECGCCQASCPSYLPLLDWVRLGKQTVMGIIRARAAAPKK